MVVGEDIAVLGDDEAGAADSGGGGHAEEILIGDLGGDTDHLLLGLFEDLGAAQHAVGRAGGHQLFMVQALGRLGGLGHLLVHAGVHALLQGGELLIHAPIGNGRAQQSAQQGEDQAQCHDPWPDALALFLLGLRLLHGPLGRCIVAGRLGRRPGGFVVRVGIDFLFAKAVFARFAAALRVDGILVRPDLSLIFFRLVHAVRPLLSWIWDFFLSVIVLYLEFVTLL